MFTPPQLSDEEGEECIESGNATYERQMLPKKHVFFLLRVKDTLGGVPMAVGGSSC